MSQGRGSCQTRVVLMPPAYVVGLILIMRASIQSRFMLQPAAAIRELEQSDPSSPTEEQWAQREPWRLAPYPEGHVR